MFYLLWFGVTDSIGDTWGPFPSRASARAKQRELASNWQGRFLIVPCGRSRSPS